MRVVVTGIGIVSPFGIGEAVFFDGLRAGRSAIREVRQYPNGGERIARFAPFVGFFEDELLERAAEELQLPAFASDPSFAPAFVAASRALLAARACGSSPELAKTALCLGSAFGQLGLLEKWMAENGSVRSLGVEEAERYRADALADTLARHLGLGGPCQLFSLACASANFALGSGFDLVRAGEVKAALCGGAEGFQEASLIGASHLGVIDREPCRPFSAGRAGFNPGVGAAFLLLESLDEARERGARPLAEILGFGASSDACHLTAPDMEGEGMGRAMEAALGDGEIEEGDVDYVNAHGTGTYINDLVETRAIKRVFGRRAYQLLVSSTKSQIGHCAGASAALEAAACCFAVLHDRVPPTINYRGVDPDCDLDYVPNRGRDCKVRVAANNSFAFGGHNSCLLVAKPGGWDR